MAIWRSPLLYLGIAIILLVTAALAAPFIVDFNRYKPRAEAWGARLTGREVKISGDIDVSLFPWPTLKLRDVSVANPPGAHQPWLLHAAEIKARLSLAALISGQLEIEKIDLRQPTFALERLKSGYGTWKLTPRAHIRLPFSPDRIAVAGVTIEDGAVILSDARRGGQASIEHINAHVSAPALTGPWRLAATGRMQGVEMTFAISTGKYRKGQPLRVSARAAPSKAGGFRYTFDGALGSPEPGKIKGRLRAAPVTAKGKQNPLHGVSLYAFKADVLADFNEIWLKNIEAAPLSAAHSANTVTGAAHIVLGSILEVEGALKAARFDLDYALGQDTRARLFGPSGLRWLSDMTAALPRDILLRLDLSVTNLLAGGETLEGLRMALDASSEQLAVNAFSVSLPGQTSLAFTGQLLPDADKPQLGGKAELDSRSLRDFVIWALPGHAAAITRVWSGARGRLKLDAAMDITPRSFRLAKGQYVLDGSEGLLVTTFRRDEKGAGHLDLRVNAGVLDIDRYAPSGLAAANGQGPGTDFLDLLAAAMGMGETALGVSASRMHIWGLPMRDVAIDILANPDLVEIRNFDIGSLKGAKIDMAGLMKFPGGGVEGSMDTRVTASDGRPLWRLLAGLETSGKSDPQWLRKVGGIDLDLKASARALDKGAQINATLTGKAGPASISGALAFTGLPARWRKAQIKLDAGMASPASRPLLALAGLKPEGSATAPANLSLKARGRPEDGLKTTISLDILGLESRFLGSVRNVSPETGFTGEGTFAMRAARVQRLLRLFGFAAPRDSQGSAYAEGKLAFSPGHARYRDIRGAFGGVSFSGALALARTGGASTLSGDIASARLDLPALARAWLTAPDGAPGRGGEILPGAEASRFRPALFSGPAIDLLWKADRLALLPGFVLPRGRLAIKQDGKALNADVSAGNADNGEVSATMSATPARGGLAFAGQTRASLPLEAILHYADGRKAVSAPLEATVTWKARARSLEGAATAMNGSGELNIGKGVLHGVAPRAFLDAVMKAKSPAEVDKLAKTVLPAGALSFPGGRRKLRIASGVITAQAYEYDAGGFSVTVRPMSEAASGKLDIGLRFRDRTNSSIPPFGLALAGPPSALRMIPDMAELKNWVAVTTLRRSMENLERVERERRRVLEEDSAFERAQAMYERWRAWDEKHRALQRRTDAGLVHREKQMRRFFRDLAARKAREEAARRKAEELKRRREEALRRKRQAEEEARRRARAAAETERKRAEVLMKAREALRRKVEASKRQAAAEARRKAQADEKAREFLQQQKQKALELKKRRGGASPAPAPAPARPGEISPDLIRQLEKELARTAPPPARPRRIIPAPPVRQHAPVRLLPPKQTKPRPRTNFKSGG